MSISIDKEPFCRALEEAGIKKVAFVYHLTIRDPIGYNKWLRESENSLGVKRLFRVKADPVAREGMLIDEIVIDKFLSIKRANDFLLGFDDDLKRVCAEYTVLAIIPEPSATFHLISA